jgi:quercetin dioxygenase-like cupin family protein
MQLRSWTLPVGALCLAVALAAAPAVAQQGLAPAVVVPNFAKAVTPANLPPCYKIVVLEGNPKTGPHLLLSRLTAGCRVPWHWHTADERAMISRGVATLEMQGGKLETLRPGSFAFVPGHHIHQFACPTACDYFLSRTAASDIHYVSPDGSEISFEQAMAAAKKPPAKKAHAKAK